MAMHRAELSDAVWTDLVRRAEDVRRRAYAPYSRFLVGASLLDESGRAFAGCNVENSSFGLTQCAERTAVCAAVAGGSQRFVALVVASVGGVAPCGACRQVLAEFSRDADLPILLVDVSGQRTPMKVTLGQLLPLQFRLE